MDTPRRDFLDSLLETPSPAGFETAGQRVWVDYVGEFADEVRTDAYGNAVAVHEGCADAPAVAFTGHADEVGYIVRTVEEDGFLRIAPIGGPDRTVSKGQHVVIHGDEPVPGVIGQTAVHLREQGSEEYDALEEQFIDIGVESAEAAGDLVEVGDPVTVATRVQDLAGERLAARGLDNRVGTWAVADGLRRAVEADVDATVYAVSTVQEELGMQGARMIAHDIDPDAVVTVDVTHATDNPQLSTKQRGPVEVGSGPVVTRGSANHPVLVDLARTAASDADVEVQLQAAGTRTGTDADAFYTSRGGVPSLAVSVPNRYMHTPVEVVDLSDLDATATLFAAMATRATAYDSFSVEV